MSVLSLVNKNIKDNKIILLILVIILVCLLYYQLMYLNKNIEGFQPTPSSTPSTKSSAKLLNSLFFINNFPKQNFKKIWENKLDNGKYISFWIRNDDINYYLPIGNVAVITDIPANINDLSQDQVLGLSYLVKGGAFPTDFEKVWDNSHNREQQPMTIWKVIPPPGYVALTDIVSPGYDKPSTDLITCLPIDAVIQNDSINDALWKTPSPKNKTSDGQDISPPYSGSVWSIGKYGFFFGKDSYDKPNNRNDKVFSIKEDLLNNQEDDPSDSQTYLKVTLKI